MQGANILTFSSTEQNPRRPRRTPSKLRGLRQISVRSVLKSSLWAAASSRAKFILFQAKRTQGRPTALKRRRGNFCEP